MRHASKWIISLASLLPLLGTGGTMAAKRLYVEPFASKSNAPQIRDAVAAELRRSGSIAVVSEESSADFVLGGGGEIWIRGYRSFSPRSEMKLPSNGTPVYGGYLSVELKNRAGVTLWSDLVTPKNPSGDVIKSLAKRIARELSEAIPRIETPPAMNASPGPAIMLSGAGATFPYPVYAKWFTNFRMDHSASNVEYDAVGSEAGVRKLLAGSVDFAASDSPRAIAEIAPDEESRYLFFPSVVGAVVPIVNLPGISQTIAFTPEALAGIYLGTIKKWNDPLLKRANRGVPLPDLEITVVHRSDGSGTSFAWSDYLSKTSAEWRTSVGSSLDPKWPAGRGAAGNDGVAKLVKELGGSIGYVEFIYALQNHLSYGSVRNRNGEFVEASLESIAAAVAHSTSIGEDFKTSIVDAPGEGSYPIATFTWIVVPARISEQSRRGAITALLQWMLGPGQRQAGALGYLPLPPELAAREENAIRQIH